MASPKKETMEPMAQRPTRSPLFTRSALMRIGKYQVVIKLIEFLIVLPLYQFVTTLIGELTGDGAVTNATAGHFLLTPQGILTIVVSLVVLALFLIFEVVGMVIVSSTIIEGQPALPVRRVIAEAFLSSRRALGPGLILILPFVVVILPLTGSFLNISALSWLKIPNFISSVIAATPTYLAAYTAAMIAFYILAFFCIFVFHFMVLDHRKTAAAFAGSFRMVKSHFLGVLGAFVGALLAIVVSVVVILAVLFGLGWIVSSLTAGSPEVQTYFQYVFLITVASTVALAVFLLPALLIHVLTACFFRFIDRAPAQTAENQHSAAGSSSVSPRRSRMPVLATGLLAIVALFGFAAVLDAFAPELTKAPSIEAVGHRGGGGDAAVENTAKAVSTGMDRGADYLEVDVQRTADGSYVIFHDDNLKRLAGRSESIQDLTLPELSTVSLQVPDSSLPPSPILTLDQLIAQTKGHTKLFVELKGKSADEDMVRDVTRKLEAAGMKNDVVLMSLDYDLVNTIKRDYPGWKAGFVYFFSVGDPSQLAGDVLIVEEGALTPAKLAAMHNAGKKVAVWTVNSEESMRKFVDWPVDFVISDNIDQWRHIEKERQQETPFNVLTDRLIPGE